MDAGAELPRGRVTFVITDIEGSTALMRELGDECVELIIRQRDLVASAARRHGGTLFGHEGDACFCAFSDPAPALAACLDAQRALLNTAWPSNIAMRVRMGVHTGAAQPYADNYISLALHQAARVAAAGHGGQILASVHTAREVGDRLPDGAGLRDLGPHRLKDFPDAEPLLQLCHPDLADAFPSLRSLSARQHNLPRTSTSFIGRVPERGRLRTLLREQGLTSIVGAGGVGKTRLALEVAGDVLPHFSDGVWLVELAAATDADSAARAFAFALGVPEQAGQPILDSVRQHIADKNILVLLDNCEHLLETAAALAALVLRNPASRVLATSREPLRLSAEYVLRLVPLAVVDLDGELSEAERLFVERVHAQQPKLRLDDSARAAVAEICRRLDGVPLALELAAGRARALSLTDLAARLRDRLGLLRGGARDLSSRQQTLRATIEWSYELLSGDERQLFERLAIFADGCDLAAAEQVCADTDLPADTVLDLLTALVDKSMVQYDERFGAQRYGMLETLREFAEEKLRARSVHVVLDRFLDWALHLAQAAVPHLTTDAAPEWMSRLVREQNNLRAALHTGYVLERPQTTLRLTTALTHFWIKRGRLREGAQWATRAAALPDCIGLDCAQLLIGLGRLLRGSDNAQAQANLERAHALGRDLGDLNVQLEALKQLTTIARDRGDYAAARDYLEQQSAALLTGNDPYRRFVVDSELATLILQQGLWPEAASALRLRLRQAEQNRWQWDQARLSNNLAIALIEQGEYAEAYDIACRGTDLFRALGTVEGVAHVLSTAGMALLRQHRAAEARHYFLESGRIAFDVGASHLAPETLERLAAAEADSGDHPLAARYVAAADALYREVGYEREPADRQFRDGLQRQLEAALDARCLSELQAAAADEPRQVLIEALGLAAPKTSSAATMEAPGPMPGWAPMTASSP